MHVSDDEADGTGRGHSEVVDAARALAGNWGSGVEGHRHRVQTRANADKRQEPDREDDRRGAPGAPHGMGSSHARLVHCQNQQDERGKRLKGRADEVWNTDGLWLPGMRAD